MKSIIKKTNKKIKDFFDVKKYKKKVNTLEVKVQALSDEQIELLKADRRMLNENINLKEHIRELKKELKELKKERV